MQPMSTSLGDDSPGSAMKGLCCPLGLSTRAWRVLKGPKGEIERT